MRGGRVTALVLVAACGLGGAAQGEGASPSRTGTPAPEQAVTGLLSALAAEDWERASDLTVKGQMVVVALAEGATVEEADVLLAGEDTAVGANFWQGFTQGLGDFLAVRPDEVRIESVEEFEAGGDRFARVEVSVPLDPNIRRIVVKRAGGWRVDVLASFASALAGKLAQSARPLHADPDAGDVLAALQEQSSSLEAALDDPEISPQLAQVVREALMALER